MMLRMICSKTLSYHLFRVKLARALEISIFRKRIDRKRKFERMKGCFERFVKKRVLIIFFG